MQLQWLQRGGARLVVALAGLALAGPAAADAELHRQAMAARQKGDMRQAAALLEQAVESFTRSVGERHPDTLTAMNNLAFTYGGLGRTAEQLALNEKVLRLRTEILGERHPNTLRSMDNLALTYGSLGRTAEHLALNERALRLRTEIQGERHPDTLTSMSNLALAYGELGRTADQLALNEKVLQLSTEILGERHPNTLRSMNNLALTYGALGRTAEQLALNEKVLKLVTEVLGERHPNTLTSMDNLGRTYGALGRTAEALALNEKVLRLRTEILGEQHPETLNSVGNLAETYGALGRTAEQLALNEEVLRLRTEILGQRHPDTLWAMNNLALTYGSLGRTAEQLALNEKVLRLRTEILGQRHPNTLTSMNNLALTYGALSRTAERLTLIQKVLQLRTEVLGERHPDTLTSMNNLAVTYGSLGRTAEQLTLNEKVLKLITEVLGERHPNTLLSMNNLAGTYGALGRTAEQLALNERVLRLSTETLGERHPKTLRSIGNTASAYLAARRPAEAAKLSEPYIAGVEWQRSQPGLSGENRRSLFEEYAAGYRAFSVVHGSLGQLSEGFHLTELGKARTLLEAMAAQRAGRAGVLPETDQTRLDDLNRQAAAFDQRIAQATNPEARGALEATRNELTRQYEALQTQLKSRYPKYAQLSDVRILGAAELPGLLDADTVGVSYVHSQNTDELGAFLIDASGLQRYVALGALPYLADAVEIVRLAQSQSSPWADVLADAGKRAWRLASGSYRLLPEAQAAPSGAREVTDPAEVSQFLGQQLLRPLAKELAGKPRWVISPDGPLAQLTFETLPFGDQDGGKAEPALLAAQIHYTQSLSVYALGRALQRQYASLQGRRSLFAMGNPQYRPTELTAHQRRSLRSAALGRGQRLSDLDPLWTPLPGTELEIKGVAALFPGSATVQLGAQATEQTLQALNARGELKNYRLLLFSAHGYLSPDEPALSAIVLGLQNKTPEADGYVTAAEWPGYDLRSDLTVLSACDTGVGRVVSGEGVMGLPFALFVAGNVNTLLTLWPVDDEGTAAFVRQFFERVRQGRSASQALAETKRAFAVHPQFAHPRFWAPFVLVGAG